MVCCEVAIQNFGLGSLGRSDTNATNGNLFDLVDSSNAHKKPTWAAVTKYLKRILEKW
jgi:hypothetical protein